MNKKLRLIPVFLLAAQLAACGSETADIPQTTSQDSAESTTAALTTADMIGFDKEDNGGKTFSMLITTSKSYEYDAEEETGDVVNDAVYNKNKMVEDYLGINLEFIIQDGAWNTRDVFNGLIKSDIMSGTGEFDLISGITVCTMPIAQDGYFMDGNYLEYCDFDHPWWIADMYDRFSCAGKLYGFIGDASLSLYKDMTVIYFNKRIWDEQKAPNPYELVRNNEWTLDKFVEVCSGMQRDLNGDGKYDETDQLTFLGEYVPCGTFQTSLELEVVRARKDGDPEYLGLTEKFITAFDKVRTFMIGEGNLRMSTIDDRSYKTMITFGNGNVATMCNFIYSTEYLRDMKDDYGILPMPKYDENQDKYISQLGTSTAMLFVPTTTKDIVLTSKVMEAMSYYTNQLVVPKYYEVALKDKYARDDDIAGMLDIIRDGAAFDFLFVYGTSLQGAPNNYFRFNDTNTTDIASAFASNEKKFINSLNQMIEKFSNIDH